MQTFTTRQCKCVHYLRKTKTQKSLSEKSNRRERERESVSARLSRGTSNRTYYFLDCSLFMTAWLHPNEIFHPDVQRSTKKPRLSANLHRPGQFACLTLQTSVLYRFQRKSQGFLQIFASLPVCMFDSAQSSPELPTKNFCLTKTCQMKRQAIHFEVAECFHAGGSLSSDGAGTTQAGSIHQRIWICCFAHLLKLTCCKTERRSEERRRKKRRREEI